MKNSKFGGKVCDVPVGSPDDIPEEGEYFPSGDYADGFIRRSLPSERFIDQMIYSPLAGREDGYLPTNVVEAERNNRALRRSMRINTGNVLGDFPGPPDRVKK